MIIARRSAEAVVDRRQIGGGIAGVLGKPASHHQHVVGS
jgi:hypothetical protein